MQLRYIAYIAHPGDQGALIRAVGGRQNVEQCETVAQVVAAARAGPASGIVWEIGAESVTEVLTGIRLVRKVDPELRQLVRFELNAVTTAAMRRLARITQRNTFVSIRGHVDIDGGILKLGRVDGHRSVELVSVLKRRICDDVERFCALESG